MFPFSTAAFTALPLSAGYLSAASRGCSAIKLRTWPGATRSKKTHAAARPRPSGSWNGKRTKVSNRSGRVVKLYRWR
jgi:hypothetical protein